MVKHKKIYSEIKEGILKILKGENNPYCINGIFDGILHCWIISPKGKPQIEVYINNNFLGHVTKYLPAPEIDHSAYIFHFNLKEYDLKEGDELILTGDVKRMKPLIIRRV